MLSGGSILSTATAQPEQCLPLEQGSELFRSQKIALSVSDRWDLVEIFTASGSTQPADRFKTSFFPPWWMHSSVKPSDPVSWPNCMAILRRTLSFPLIPRRWHSKSIQDQAVIKQGRRKLEKWRRTPQLYSYYLKICELEAFSEV